MSFKWICGWIGWISTHSVLGGIVGFVIGSVIDSAKGSKSDADSGYSQGGRGDAYTGGNTYSEDFPHDPRVGERNSFLFSLMVLSAHVIQADGKILDSELRYVRGFLRTNFGADAESDGERILNKLFEYRRINGEITWRNQIYQACREMAAHMIPEHRLQLISLLCEISKADGHVADAEVAALREIATNLGLYAGVVDQMLHMGGASLDDDYALLGIDKNATDDEVRKAYRKMAMQHHPDRVATLGEDIKRQAQKKFQEINAAKDRIYKSRNMQ